MISDASIQIPASVVPLASARDKMGWLLIDTPSSLLFFQAEDGIRDIGVTGVQTCALPIWTVPIGLGGNAGAIVSVGEAVTRAMGGAWRPPSRDGQFVRPRTRTCASRTSRAAKIGRASCRERV